MTPNIELHIEELDFILPGVYAFDRERITKVLHTELTRLLAEEREAPLPPRHTTIQTFESPVQSAAVVDSGHIGTHVARVIHRSLVR